MGETVSIIPEAGFAPFKNSAGNNLTELRTTAYSDNY